ncbi:MAG: nickel pincer cofactor biosynthesis protein LarB [Pseudomonadota bacterium]
MSDLLIDWDRAARTGVPEAVYCEAKTPDQITRILAQTVERGTRMLFTRLDPGTQAQIDPKGLLDYDPISHTGVYGGSVNLTDCGAAVVSAGTSDAKVVGEAKRTLEFMGVGAPTRQDVGVAGLWRVIDAAKDLQDRRVIIAVAGFEAALFSVLAGLVAAPVIAVPTSVGSGVAQNGQTALGSALASCAPGVVTVNIDNGFGAACAALKMLNAGGHGPAQMGEMP